MNTEGASSNRDSDSESTASPDTTESIVSLSVSCRECGSRMWKRFRDLSAVPDKVDWKCACGEVWQTHHYKVRPRYQPYRPPKRKG